MDRKRIEKLEDDHYQAQQQFEAFEWELQDALSEARRRTEELADYISYAARESGDTSFSIHLDDLGESLILFENDIQRKRNQLEDYRNQEMKAYQNARDW